MENQFVLVTINWAPGGLPALEQVAKHLNISMDSFDTDFGLVNVDTSENTYTFRIKASEWEKVSKRNDVHGPFSDPSIEPFDIQ